MIFVANYASGSKVLVLWRKGHKQTHAHQILQMFSFVLSIFDTEPSWPSRNLAALRVVMLSCKAWTLKLAQWQLWHHCHDWYHFHSKLLHHFTLPVFGVFMSQPIKSTVRIFPPATAAWSTRANRWHTREHFCRAPAEAAFLKRCIFITTQHLVSMLQIHCINLWKTKRDKLLLNDLNATSDNITPLNFLKTCVLIPARNSVISTCSMLYICQMGWGLQTLQTHSCGHFNILLCVCHQVIMLLQQDVVWPGGATTKSRNQPERITCLLAQPRSAAQLFLFFDLTLSVFTGISYNNKDQ